MLAFTKLSLSVGLGLSLSACGATTGLFKQKPAESVSVQVPNGDTPRAKSRPNAEEANLAAIKSVTPQEIAEATARPNARPEQDLGSTIVSLGLLDRDGLWLRTPLVKSEAAGRVIYTKLGNSANVTLLPIAGDAGAGSQLSLAAMQVLGVPLTELAEVQVFVR